MTYKDLAEKIKNMSVVKQNSDVTVLLMESDEVVSVCDFVVDWDVEQADKEAFGIDQVDGILDDNHPYFTISF